MKRDNIGKDKSSKLNEEDLRSVDEANEILPQVESLSKIYMDLPNDLPDYLYEPIPEYEDILLQYAPSWDTVALILGYDSANEYEIEVEESLEIVYEGSDWVMTDEDGIPLSLIVDPNAKYEWEINSKNERFYWNDIKKCHWIRFWKLLGRRRITEDGWVYYLDSEEEDLIAR